MNLFAQSYFTRGLILTQSESQVKIIPICHCLLMQRLMGHRTSYCSSGEERCKKVGLMDPKI